MTKERISDINATRKGQMVTLRARVHNSRKAGGKLCFFVLRQQQDTIQGVLHVNEEMGVTKAMHTDAVKIPRESVIEIEAEVTVPKDIIKSCTVHDAELSVRSIKVVSESEPVLPFSLEDASREEAEGFCGVHLDTRLNSRVIDLRIPSNQAIFKIKSGICSLIREFLQKKDFMEIHTPKLLPTASEGGSSVFEVTYFDRKAYLAQSPQFYKQMMICSDFPRVYEIAPVFRAENSFTNRHMTEFTGVDLEMEIENYNEVLDLLEDMFAFLFENMQKFAKESNVILKQYPNAPFEFKRLRLKYPEAVKMLRESGLEMGDYDDLSTEMEKALGRLVRKKYQTDFFLLEQYPESCRPFYTMPDENGYSRSYDFFMRGEEILSGAQRIHDYQQLMQNVQKHGITPSTMQSYLDAFKYGVPPHAGAGIGLERIVMLYFGLNSIKMATLFPRDPKRLSP